MVVDPSDAGDELLLTGGTVYARLPAAAGVRGGVRVRGGEIVAVGAADELGAAGPRCRRVDLAGGCVLPGWIDAHTHLLAHARASGQLDLTGTLSAAETARRAAGARGDGWILGRGWERHQWRDPTPPHRRLLDAVTGPRPALFVAHDGHAGWANSAALARAGIDARTSDPVGGRIEREADAAPTGLLLENALDLVARVVERPARADERALLEAALHHLVALGVTGIHDLEDGRAFGLFLDLARDGALPLRVEFYFPGERLDELERLGVATGLGDDRLRVAGVKFFLDGTLGSRTAAMLAPYEGDPDHCGMLLLAPDEFAAQAGRAAAAGLAVAVHCIGDRAVRVALDVLERLPRARAPHRIEHAQCVDPADIGRFARAGVVASMQPAQLFLDMEPAEREWGERASRAYPFRSLLGSGALLAFGSDVPVEDPDPRRGLYAAVARCGLDGAPAGGWHGEEAVALGAALAAYSEGAARAGGSPPPRGRLEVGAPADLVVLARDPFARPPADLLSNPVVLTLVGGVPVHSMPDAACDLGKVVPARIR